LNTFDPKYDLERIVDIMRYPPIADGSGYEEQVGIVRAWARIAPSTVAFLQIYLVRGPEYGDTRWTTRPAQTSAQPYRRIHGKWVRGATKR
jgi:hypothetical protein